MHISAYIQKSNQHNLCPLELNSTWKATTTLTFGRTNNRIVIAQQQKQHEEQMSAVVALKKGFDWRSYDENFTEQSDEILALYCFYESTDVLTIQEEASLEQGSTFKLQFSVPIRVDELYEDWLTAEVWLSSDNIGDGQICEDQMVDGCVASTSMAAALEHGERANAGNGSVKLNRSISGKNARASISCRFLPDVMWVLLTDDLLSFW